MRASAQVHENGERCGRRHPNCSLCEAFGGDAANSVRSACGPHARPGVPLTEKLGSRVEESPIPAPTSSNQERTQNPRPCARSPLDRGVEALLPRLRVLEVVEGHLRPIGARRRQASVVTNLVAVQNASDSNHVHAVLHVVVFPPTLPRQALALLDAVLVRPECWHGEHLDRAVQLRRAPLRAVGEVHRLAGVGLQVRPQAIGEEDGVGIHLHNEVVGPEVLAVHERVPRLQEGARVQE
mmetsp:Transcript_49492/g.139292  ORF Transcript_49492/g.139292 Transcript_49492/m.139292 type:complete len:239 (-) Transcript_49492:930-1646(-)